LKGTPCGFYPGVNSAAKLRNFGRAGKGVVAPGQPGGIKGDMLVPPFFKTLPPIMPPFVPGTWHTLPDAIARQNKVFRGKKKKAGRF
jgi:hypothetical protein